MLRRCLAVSVVAVLVASVSAAAQTADLSRIERLDTWLTTVERHEPGAVDSALIVAAALSTSDLQELWHSAYVLIKLAGNPRHTGSLRITITTLGRSRVFVYGVAELSALRVLVADVQRRGGIERLIKRGALLHADVAMLTPTVFEANDGTTPHPAHSGRSWR